MIESIDDCREACLECHRICLETASYLSTAPQPVDAEDIRLLFNTADVCRASAGLLRGNSDRSGQAYAACAALCEETARYLDLLGDDPRVHRCAEACRRCAAACRGVAMLAA